MFYGCSKLQLVDIRGLECSGITNSNYYSSALSSVPTTVKIVVKNATEKSWWKGKFSSYTKIYTVDEAIAQGIVRS